MGTINKKSPETFGRSRGFCLPWIVFWLHTTSDPETSGGKVKIPEVGVQQTHAILKGPSPGANVSTYSIVVYASEKARGKKYRFFQGVVWIFFSPVSSSRSIAAWAGWDCSTMRQREGGSK